MMKRQRSSDVVIAAHLGAEDCEEPAKRIKTILEKTIEENPTNPEVVKNLVKIQSQIDLDDDELADIEQSVSGKEVAPIEKQGIRDSVNLFSMRASLIKKETSNPQSPVVLQSIKPIPVAVFEDDDDCEELLSYSHNALRGD